MRFMELEPRMNADEHGVNEVKENLTFIPCTEKKGFEIFLLSASIRVYLWFNFLEARLVLIATSPSL